MIKIGLDASHGGLDLGAVYNGRKESEDVLELGLAVAEKLRSSGIIVGESRTTDTFVSLHQRAMMSNKREDNFFISIHRNAVKPETAQGVETYVHPKASPQAIQLAKRIQNELRGVGFVDREVKTANFQVLRETKAPAVLVELGFIDNTKDNLLFDMKKEEIIQALVGAILAQVELNQPSGEEDSIRLDDAIDVLGEHGIIDTPAYWQKHAKPKQVVNGDYAALLLKRMAAFLIRDRNLEP